VVTFAPTVSIVVPVYNGADTIATCLESLLNQDYPAEAYEIIVAENGSTDNTTEIVKEYPVRLFHSDRRGPSPARNLGVSHSQADIIAFTDADCVATPQWLSQLVQPYVQPKVGGVGGAVGGAMLGYDHPNRNMIEKFSDECSPLVNFISGEDEFLPRLYTANASYRRYLFEEIGGFNTNLVTAEDVDLAWRLQLKKKNIKLCYASEAVIYHHHRTTRTGLARQYRQYGFGEILLDTMYGKYPGYPRNRAYQFRRIFEQILALPRYGISALVRCARWIGGRATSYQAVTPLLCFLIESNNIRGKFEGLMATRFMTDAEPALNMDAEIIIERFFQNKKE